MWRFGRERERKIKREKKEREIGREEKEGDRTYCQNVFLMSIELLWDCVELGNYLKIT